MAMVKWSDFIPPEYAPVAYGLGAAAAGGGLGWLYDKLRGKKHTARRVGIGALIGGIGGLGYGQNILNEHLVRRDYASEARGSEKQRNDEVQRLKGILDHLGIDTRGNEDAVSLKGEIMSKLLEEREAPSGVDRNDVDRIHKQLTSNNDNVARALEFVMGLNGQDVIVVPKRR